MLHPRIIATLTGLWLLLAAGSPARAEIWNFTKISPTKGPWGTKVRLYGYGFNKTAKVYYAGQLVKPLSINRSVIVARVPDHTRSGWFEIQIGDRQLRAPVLFRVKNTPKVTDMQPRSGPPGIWVTVKGQHLPANMRFWIGRTPVRRRYVNRTTYKLLIHTGLKGGVMYYSFGKRRQRSRWRFKPARFPVLNSFSPKRGYFGDEVELKGLSICSNAKAYLGSTALRVVRRDRDRSLVVQLPKGVSTGRFVVQCYGKQVTAGDEFVVEPPYAEVTGISPTAGK